MLVEKLAEWYMECIMAYGTGTRPRWTHRKKLYAVEIMLRSLPYRSDRSLCAETGFSRELISRVRNRLVSEGEIPAGYRVGVDGKRYNMAIKT